MTFDARARRRSGGAALFLLVFVPALAEDLAAQKPVYIPEDVPARVQPLPSLREQAAEQQEWLELRIGRILPALMAEYDVRMWILSMREYAEDPVFWSITSPTTFAARRRSIYVFTRQDDGTVERLALGGTDQGGVFQAYRSTRPAPTQPTAELVGNEQWRLLRELVEDRDPGEHRPQHRSRLGLLRRTARRGARGAGGGAGPGADGAREARAAPGHELHRPAPAGDDAPLPQD